MRIDWIDTLDDVLWMNPAARAVASWSGQPNGSFVLIEHSVTTNYDLGGQIIAVGDFSTDGRTDLMSQDHRWPTNVYYTFNIEGNFFGWPETTLWIGLVPAGNRMIGVGDFDGNGRDDLLWHMADGNLTQWQISDDWSHYWDAPVYTVNQSAILPAPAGWSLDAVGDFNGDGRDDLLWRNGDGVLSQWLAGPGGHFAWNPHAAQGLGTDWQIKAVGDFNGDGKDDLLWRNFDGAMAQWLGQADGSFAWNPAFARQLPNEWTIAGAGDYNGDGFADLLWRNDSGTITNWLAQPNGDFVSNHANAWYEMGPDWIPAHSTTGVVDWLV